MARVLLLLVLLIPLATACATGPPSADTSSTTHDPWVGLATPRTPPVSGAPRIALGEIVVTDAWGATTPVTPSVGLQELVVAGMLRRGDVQVVDRCRFNALAELERQGLPRPAGAPALGVTPGAEFLLLRSTRALGDSTFLELRLVNPSSGETRAAWRATAARVADPPALARAAVATLLEALMRLERLPSWEDPIPEAAPSRYVPSGIPDAAWRAFLTGIAAEDRYDWEGARGAYQRALRLAGPSFLEAEAALARAARMRAGGTLGAG